MAIKGRPWSENRRIEKKPKNGKNKIEQFSIIHIVNEYVAGIVVFWYIKTSLQADPTKKGNYNIIPAWWKKFSIKN
jgi:hypothetical protein